MKSLLVATVAAILIAATTSSAVLVSGSALRPTATHDMQQRSSENNHHATLGDDQMMYVCPAATKADLTVTMMPCAATGAVAWGTYNRSGNMTGWNVLRVETNSSSPDEHQSYAGGLIEGYGAAQDMLNFHHNTLGPNGSWGVGVNAQILDFLHKNDLWMQQQAAANKATDVKWRMVSLLLDQIAGMIAGVQQKGFTEYTRAIYMLQLAMPDVISDLQIVYPDTPDTPAGRAFPAKFTRQQRMHCSSIVKVTADMQNILFGQVTWMQFNTMLRVYKMVTFNFNTVPLQAKTISYSGYPGTLASTDDFYALSSGFGVMETSLSIFNLTLYNVLTPKSLMSSMRTMLANRLATNGSHWAETFKFHNSGTYNNQWMVVNLNLFTPGKDLKPGTLWIVEQIPGLIEAADHTTILSFGYWPSYNIPFSKKIFDLAGFPSQVAMPGGEVWNDYQLACRAQLFRSLQGTITDIASLQNVLQYNQWETNPLEHGNSGEAISSRYDLLASNPTGFGGLDCKVSSYNDWMLNDQHLVHAFSGPTPQQPTFSFKTSQASQLNPHQGLPQTFNFTWQQYTP